MIHKPRRLFRYCQFLFVLLALYPQNVRAQWAARAANPSAELGVEIVHENPAAVLTYHYDALRTGWNQYETTLTAENVKTPSFGLLHSVLLDGDRVDAQPLFVADQDVAGQGKHDVVYVATESNTIFAIDATTGAVLKQQSLGAPVPLSKIANCLSYPTFGINSTPVIDLVTKTLFVMAFTLQSGNPIYQLHALDLSTLSDKVPPKLVNPSHTLTEGKTYNFTAAVSQQRSGLLAANGNIYAGFGSFCDWYPDLSRGWLLGWRAASLQPLPTNELINRLQRDPVASPGPVPFTGPAFLSSIWMSGYGVAADASGDLFLVTGNSDSNTLGTSYRPPDNLQESVVKVQSDLSKVSDYFTPWDAACLDKEDYDFGSGGVMLLPDQPGPKPHLAVAAGKPGQMFLLDRDNLGGFNANGPNKVLGTFDIGGACWCGESYFLAPDGVGRIVSSGGKNVIVWKVQTSPSVTLTQESKSLNLDSGPDPGFFTSVSSNGQVPGTAIIWATARPTDASPAIVTLYALDGQNGTKLFSDKAGTWPWPTPNGGNANIVPVVANGKVYVASDNQLTIFGLGQTIPFTPPPPRTLVAEAEVPAGHKVYGTIDGIEGSEITLKTRTGSTLNVDATNAQRAGHSIPLVVGRPAAVQGTIDPSGVMHAGSIARARPSPALWPPDR